jgi:hypothetical protein
VRLAEVGDTVDNAVLFERCNGPARRALQLAFREAARRQHDFLGTEHLLFGLLCDHAGPCAAALQGLTQAPEAIQARLDQMLHDEETGAAMEQFPLSPALQRALRFAHEESALLGQALVGPEHLLLGLLRENDTQASVVLASFGVTLDDTRRIVRARPAAEKEEFKLQLNLRPLATGGEPSAADLQTLVGPLVPSVEGPQRAGSAEGEGTRTDIAAPVLSDALRQAEALEKQLRRTQVVFGAVLGFFFGHIIAGWQFGLLAAMGGVCLTLLHSSFAGAWMGFMAGFVFLPGFLQDGDDRVGARARILFGIIGALLGSFLGDFWRPVLPREEPVEKENKAAEQGDSAPDD